jgi:cystathionine beta-synthase
MAMKMIDDAEADGRLQPGGTIIEGTSEYRNGISTSSIIRGYKLICVISDKTSKKNGYLESCWCKVVVLQMLSLLILDLIFSFSD